MKRLSVVVFAVLCLASVVRAGEEKKKNPYDENKNTDLALDVAQAGADYKVQGEYAGEITTADGKKKFGAQIMALGGATFRAVYYFGGLPGDGWMGDKTQRVITEKEWVADGKTEGDKTVFEKPFAASISGDTITGKTDKGDAFECKKVMRQSPTLGAPAPVGAKVLFDGTNLDNWTGKGEIDERKYLTTTHGNAYTKEKYKDFSAHVEYMEPFKPYGREQDRGNSGVYIQNRYECQVLDSFGRFGKDNEAGGIYHKVAPKVNMVFPPLSWQSYDIDFTAAKYDDFGKKVKNAMLTSKHNGVVVHENQEIDGPTGGGQKETPEAGELQLQGHGNPVFFRNIWIIAK